MLVSERLKITTELYANCVAYSDQGTVTSKNVLAQTVSTGKFRTIFKRSESFHFDWDSLEAGKKLVFHSDSERTVLTSSSGWTDVSDTLELGICSLFGASQGAAYVVPALLLASLIPGRPRVTGLEEAALEQAALEQSTEGLVKVVGRLHNAPCELWLRETDGAVLRCVTKMVMTAQQQHSMIQEITGVLTEQGLPVPEAGAFSWVDDITYEHVEIELRQDQQQSAPV